MKCLANNFANFPQRKKKPRLQYYGVKGPGFDPRSRHYGNDIRDWLSLASESEYDWNNLMQRKSSKQPNPNRTQLLKGHERIQYPAFFWKKKRKLYMYVMPSIVSYKAVDSVWRSRVSNSAAGGQRAGHLPKARVESCSAATTLALYVKNFPGWPTLFPSHWGRPIRELAYTVTYYFDTMNDLNMYAIYLPELNGLRGRMDKTLAFWSRGREFKTRSWQFFSVCNLA